ncbi:MAG: F0F1 ATP synthase subunit A [Bacteroidota bacterium]|nr:F0F1 ATP synthase subunit A [Bacteroidota bacterium]
MKRLFVILFIVLSFLLPANVLAEQKSEEFNVGNTIMQHLGDEHSWEICSIKGHEIAIPLPVILIDAGKVSVFMSSKLEEGKTYNNFRFASDKDSAKLKGKIIKVNKNNVYLSTPLDLSITKNVFGIMIVCAVIVFVVLYSVRKSKQREGKEPKGLQTVMEFFIGFIGNDIAKPNIGERYEKYMNYLLSVFLFIFLCNLFGLMPFFPGGANITGNIAVTIVLALFTFITVMISTTKHYWVDIVNPKVPTWLKIPIPLMPALEVVEIFTKPFSLCVRLFANITAGHVIMLAFVCIIFIFGGNSPIAGYGFSVVSILFGVFMFLVECLVAFIQAYVFTFLSAIYIGMALGKE